MTAFDRLMVLRGREGLDVEVLRLLTRVVVDIAVNVGPEEFTVTRFIRLLDNIGLKVASSPAVFEARAMVHAARGESAQSIEAREKQCRAAQTKGWMDAEASLAEGIAAVKGLGEAYLQVCLLALCCISVHFNGIYTILQVLKRTPSSRLRLRITSTRASCTLRVCAASSSARARRTATATGSCKRWWSS